MEGVFKIDCHSKHYHDYSHDNHIAYCIHHWVVGECYIEQWSYLYRNLTRAEAQIGELSAGLDEVDKEVAVLREKLNRSTKEAVEVEFHLNKAKETMTAAESLVTKLEGEYKRWSQQVSDDDLFLSPKRFALYVIYEKDSSIDECSEYNIK